MIHAVQTTPTTHAVQMLVIPSRVSGLVLCLGPRLMLDLAKCLQLKQFLRYWLCQNNKLVLQGSMWTVDSSPVCLLKVFYRCCRVWSDD